MATKIRDVFSQNRPIDRTIEKVIDYYADATDRLAAEIGEYEITDNIETCFRTFLERFRDGVTRGQVAEIGIWVSGFYGSGKSSFTKYLGFALDPSRRVGDKLFLDLLCERFSRSEIPGMLRTLAKQEPTAVILLDLGAEQLVDSTTTPVANVLYWKVMQWAGYSREKKLAQLEFALEKAGKYDLFKEKYRDRYKQDWLQIHNDPLIGVTRAAEIIPNVLPEEYDAPTKFSSLRFEEAKNLRVLAQDVIDLCRKKSQCKNILFLIDEAGQYVAPRGELILNLDGFSRNLKELGHGRVWVAATGQQTLAEIVERATINSAELIKLRDRFPIAINLDAKDIREVTYRRLLTKSEAGEKELRSLFQDCGAAMATNTRLSGTTLFKGDPDANAFVRFYPFLPQHFELLLELIRTLARSTGGVGLRSAIRVIQDVLVDKSRVLPASVTKLADRPVGTLACVDDFYDTLENDIGKVLPHVPRAVAKVIEAFPAKPLFGRVAKAVAALQPLEAFPRTDDNIAALLYPRFGDAPLLDEVRGALKAILAQKECGLIEDPQSGGYLFLSDAVQPLKSKRQGYVPSSAECQRLKAEVLRQGASGESLFANQPSARLDNIKEVRGAVRLGKNLVVGGAEEIDFRLEFVDPATWDAKRADFLHQTIVQRDLKNAIIWMARHDTAVDDSLAEIARSQRIIADTDSRQAEHDIAQFLRAEHRLADRYRDALARSMGRALMDGTLIFRGRPIPASELAQTLDATARVVLGQAAADVFSLHHLAAQKFGTDSASRFLEVDRLDRMPSDVDPLKVVKKQGGAYRIDITNAALAEVLREFTARAKESGANRLQGNFLQDHFSSQPYGWSKDAVRYLFAVLLVAGEVEFHVPGVDGAVRTRGPQAIEAVKSTVAFNRVGVSPRDGRPSAEALDRAARRLEELLAVEVLPLEERISEVVRKHLPAVMENIGPLPDRLRLLGLTGEDRARQVLGDAADLLKGDAGNATGVLGAADCSIPGDIQWAKSVIKILDEGAESDIRATRSLLDDCAQIANLFPTDTAGLLDAGQLQTLNEILASDRFHERLPDLRAATRGLLERVVSLYARSHVMYVETLTVAQRRLQSHPDWPRLDEDDRQELALRLRIDLPESPDQRRPVQSLQMLLVRVSALPGMLQNLLVDVDRRVPPPPQPPPGQTPAVEILEAAEIIRPVSIRSLGDLDAWLAQMRAAIAGRLASNKTVQVVLKKGE